MTAAQIGAVCRLRVNHPRATVSVLPDRQAHDDTIVVKMRWQRTTITRYLFIDRDGRRYLTVRPRVEHGHHETGCPVCGRDLPPAPRRPRVYCSSRCRMVASRDRRDLAPVAA